MSSAHFSLLTARSVRRKPWRGSQVPMPGVVDGNIGRLVCKSGRGTQLWHKRYAGCLGTNFGAAVFYGRKGHHNVSNAVRQKLAQMITEVVHQRDVSRQLISDKVCSPKDFQWLQLMRMYWNPSEPQILQRLSICMADAVFFYGFEYLGIADKLVQTPLTDRCFLTLTQALHMRLGANPFGPAGDRKDGVSESIGKYNGALCPCLLL